MTFLRSLPLFALACSLHAQPTLITLSDSLYTVSGNLIPAGSTITLYLGYSVLPVSQSLAIWTFTSGSPNIGGVIATSPSGVNLTAQYSVIMPNGVRQIYTRYWTIPASGGPYTITSRETNTPPTPNLSVNVNQIKPPCPPGQVVGTPSGQSTTQCFTPAGAGSIPNTTNIIKGDGAGNGADSGISSSSVIRSFAQNVLSNSSATSTVTLSSSPVSGHYEIHFDLDLHTPCTTGTGTVFLVIGWTGNSARSLTTGSLQLTSTQGTSNWINGVIPIDIGGGSVTFTPTLGSACATGTATWDGKVYLTGAS
jgi:hypothetical protein